MSTWRSQIWRPALAGILSVTGLLVLASQLPDPDADNSLVQFGIDLCTLLACLLLAVFIGIPIARVISKSLSRYLRTVLATVNTSLDEYEKDTKWPGREFAELLRRVQRPNLRQDFLIHGLDSYFRVPGSEEREESSRVSSLLVQLEHAALEHHVPELAIAPRTVNSLLRRRVLIHRLRVLATRLTYTMIPCVVAVVAALVLCPDEAGYCLPRQPETHAAWLQANPELLWTVVKLAMICILPMAAYAAGHTFHLFASGWAARTRTQLDDIVVNVASWFAAGLVGLLLLRPTLKLAISPALARGLASLAHPMIPGSFDRSATSRDTFLGQMDAGSFFCLSMFLIAWTTLLGIVLLRGVCTRILAKLAAKTQQKHDDVMVEMLRIFGTLIIGAMGLGWAVIVFSSQYGKFIFEASGGVQALMPYVILIAVSGTILGIASKDLLENFFAGISLQIDRPFEKGERVIVQSGAICEVKSIGMRSTHFFVIMDNTDLFIPNTELARQPVTNISRRDREFRRSLQFNIVDRRGSLEQAHRLLLLGAYTVRGVDLPVVLHDSSERSTAARDRPGIAAEFERLQEQYEECAQAKVRSQGQLRPIGDLISEKCRLLYNLLQELEQTAEERWDSDVGTLGWSVEQLDEDPGRKDQIKIAAKTAYDASYATYEIAMLIHSLATKFPLLRSDLDRLTHELLRSPSVQSRQILTEGGQSAWQLELRVYTGLTDRSNETLHYVNILIQQLLHAHDLVPRSDASVAGDGRPPKAEDSHQQVTHQARG